MQTAQRFGAYAAAFEKAVAQDDWSELGQYFAPDAVYLVSGGPPLGGRAEGRDAVVEKLRRGVDDLDRRFDTRKVELVGEPIITETSFTMDWRATYQMAGCPEFSFDGTEVVTFDGESIGHLEDRIEDGADDRFAAYAARYMGGAAR